MENIWIQWKWDETTKAMMGDITQPRIMRCSLYCTNELFEKQQWIMSLSLNVLPNPALFMALNCFILIKTALSIGLSDASPSSLSHGCSDQLINQHFLNEIFGTIRYRRPWGRLEINMTRQNFLKYAFLRLWKRKALIG
ncbi:cytochrome P450 [Striga asiatica]|uniref:Cytochrome P450 n=1 Tax=Striga asiatica TaxID=4170 RepID=A0A5A7Q9W3_STRAF|nr:cytochrome P450 [Striga asiatica]